MTNTFDLRKFIMVTLVTSIWVNISEVFRYFVFVMPEMRSSLAVVDGVAPMSISVFAIWGLWDTLLTALTVFMFWIYSQQFGNNLRSVVISASFSWAFLFVLFWLGMVNMGLASWSILAITLPLSWIELVVASYIASKMYHPPKQPHFNNH